MKQILVHYYQKIKTVLLIVFIFFLYDLLFIKSPRAFFTDILGLRYFVNYAVSVLALILFVLIIDNLFKRSLIFKIISAILLIVPLGIQTAHYAFYSMPLNAYGIHFFIHDPILTTKLGFENINILKIILFILFSVFILYLFLKNTAPIMYKNSKLFIYFSLYLPIVTLCGINWYLILDYQNPVVSVYAAVPEVGRSFYFKKLKVNKPQMVLPPTKEKIPNIVWIIGESVTKTHMSLYGYKRKTTPNLDNLRDKGELIPFQNVVSTGPHTIVSVPYMMVGLQNIDPQGMIYSTPNIFEYAKARGYETAFLSSQDLRWRNFDQLVGGNGVVDFFRSGPDFSSNVSVAKGADDMKVLDQAILPHLKQMRSPFLLVAHMDGSHYPYSLHSEPQYKKFLPEDDPNSVNAYDNTLIYSDIYLEKLIAAARKKDPNVWIFYSTDHGQPVQVPESFAVNNTPGVEIPSPPPPPSGSVSIVHVEEKKDAALIESSLFSEWRKKINEMFAQSNKKNVENKITFNQGYETDIIHNAFFVVPPENYKKIIADQQNSPVAQSDIFATILALMDVQKPLSPIDGLSLLGDIPTHRLRVSTGFVVTNDNVPEAEVVYPDYSSVFVDFSRSSVSLKDGKTVVPFEKAPKEIQEIFPKY
ncbi:MAG: sulfatase-like hydrolase/transferase [Bdellovibrionota bacterium]